jgi:hypothetical protein
MTERQQLPRRNRRAARSVRPAAQRPAVRHPETIPTEPPPLVVPQSDPTLFGLPAERAAARPNGPAPGEPPNPAVLDTVTTADRLVAVRRQDGTAGSLLLVAGAAGLMSLFLPWKQHGSELGVTLVRRGFDFAGSDLQQLVTGGLLLPMGVAIGGGVLFVLGLLAFRPARSHRPTGVVALFVSLAVAAGVIVRVADASWASVRTDPGILCAILVAAFGLLGALKAMLTAPEFRAE